MTDMEYMRRALELAERGAGHVSPNPMVGAVIVKDGRIIGEGWHEHIGGLHAERNALKNCTEDPSGATIYVTLEPCCHWGRTPPCTEAIMENKLSRVVVGCLDPNPLVAGNGVKILKEHGIEVVTGILEQECLKLNEIFFHYIREKTPFTAMKYAMTLDGKIAAFTGDSRWVTGEEARRDVHLLRKKYSGIMAGIGTVLADDPMLNCRIEEGVDPVRIICDSRLRIPMESRLVRTARDIPLIVAGAEELWTDAEHRKAEQLEAAGVRILRTPGRDGVDLSSLMRQLGGEGIDSVLLEGGAQLNASALKAGIVHRVYAYIAPKLIGGMNAKGPVAGEGIARMKDAVLLSDIRIRTLGEDLCLTGRIRTEAAKEESKAV